MAAGDAFIRDLGKLSVSQICREVFDGEVTETVVENLVDTLRKCLSLLFSSSSEIILSVDIEEVGRTAAKSAKVARKL